MVAPDARAKILERGNLKKPVDGVLNEAEVALMGGSRLILRGRDDERHLRPAVHDLHHSVAKGVSRDEGIASVCPAADGCKHFFQHFFRQFRRPRRQDLRCSGRAAATSPRLCSPSSQNIGQSSRLDVHT